MLDPKFLPWCGEMLTLLALGVHIVGAPCCQVVAEIGDDERRHRLKRRVVRPIKYFHIAALVIAASAPLFLYADKTEGVCVALLVAGPATGFLVAQSLRLKRPNPVRNFFIRYAVQHALAAPFLAIPLVLVLLLAAHGFS